MIFFFFVLSSKFWLLAPEFYFLNSVSWILFLEFCLLFFSLDSRLRGNDKGGCNSSLRAILFTCTLHLASIFWLLYFLPLTSYLLPLYFWLLASGFWLLYFYFCICNRQARRLSYGRKRVTQYSILFFSCLLNPGSLFFYSGSWLLSSLFLYYSFSCNLWINSRTISFSGLIPVHK